MVFKKFTHKKKTNKTIVVQFVLISTFLVTDFQDSNGEHMGRRKTHKTFNNSQ
jgi:hypothetical protein